MSRFYSPRLFEIDGNGNPLSGAKLYFYQSGTTTPEAVYADAALTTPLSNPVVADGNGRFVDIYLSSASYKVVMTTASDVVIYTADPVVAPPTNIGSTLVTVTGGTEARPLADKLAEVVSPMDFGAVGDGVTDDGAAISAAISSSASVVDGAGRTYKLDSALTLRSNIEIRNAVFDFSGASSSAKLFVAHGTEGTATLLTANAAEGASSVQVASVADFAAEDLIFISSTDDFYVDSSPGKYGEYARVKSIGGTTLTLYDALFLPYTTTASAQVVKVSPLRNITLRNVRATGGGTGLNHMMADFYRCENVQVIDCHGDLFAERHIQLRRCYGARVRGGTYRRSSAAGTAYGIAVNDGSFDVEISGVRGEDLRHLVTVGGVNGVSRVIKAHHCSAVNMRDAAFDSHPNGDDVDFSHNTVHMAPGVTNSAIIFQCPNATAIGNRVYNAGGIGIIHQQWTTRTGSVNISNNEIYGASGATQGIDVTPSSSATGLLYGVTVSGNRIRGFATPIRIYALSVDMYRIVVVGNTNTDSSGSTSNSILLRTATGRKISTGTIGSNTMSAATGVSRGVYLLGADAASIINLAVVGNTIIGNNAGHGVSGTNTDFILTSGNVIIGFTTGDVSVAGANSVVGTNL